MERKFKVNNTVYQRSKRYGVGKEIGCKLYIHKNYVGKVISAELLNEAESLLPDWFSYNCIMIDLKNPNVIRFDESPDFNYAREPHPGDFVEVDISTKNVRYGHSNFIWHHKWMWVMDDYKGFDVEKSYQWSKTWTQYITHPSGSKKIWENQINEINY